MFCGTRPFGKNNEHVVPYWLIEMTGDPKRQWNLGVRFLEDGGQKERSFSADQFAFPACEICNQAYSALEGRSKINMKKIIANEPLKAVEWGDLLDWFDKVRIGLWLGMKMLNPNLPQVSAKFHINQRIGRKDRCVIAYRVNPEHTGLIMTGVGDPPFIAWPSCLGLTINGMIFLNFSIEYLLASRMGLPFPRKIVDLGGVSNASDFDCHYRLKVPFIRFDFLPPVIQVYQAILHAPDEVFGNETAKYFKLCEHEYIRSTLAPGSATRSCIHTIGDGKSIKLEPNAAVEEQELSHQDYRHGLAYLKQLYAFRGMQMTDYVRSGRGAAPNDYIKAMIKFNRKGLDHIGNQLRSELAKEVISGRHK